MATFFTDKIRAIHEGLAEAQNASFPSDPDKPHRWHFTDFTPDTEKEVTKNTPITEIS